MPDPMPRPTRLRFSFAFFGALSVDKFIAMSQSLSIKQSLDSRRWSLAEPSGPELSG
jgi:hypothetical protein